MQTADGVGFEMDARRTRALQDDMEANAWIALIGRLRYICGPVGTRQTDK